MSGISKNLIDVLGIVDQMAAAMWQQEASRAGSEGVAQCRTLDTFLNQDDRLCQKWRGSAIAAIMVLIDVAPTSLTITTDDGYTDVDKIKEMMKTSRPPILIQDAEMVVTHPDEPSILKVVLDERERCAEMAAAFIHNRFYKPRIPVMSFHHHEIKACLLSGEVASDEIIAELSQTELEAKVLAAAKTLWAVESWPITNDACVGVSKVYKFNAVLQNIAETLEKGDA